MIKPLKRKSGGKLALVCIARGLPVFFSVQTMFFIKMFILSIQICKGPSKWFAPINVKKKFNKYFSETSITDTLERFNVLKKLFSYVISDYQNDVKKTFNAILKVFFKKNNEKGSIFQKLLTFKMYFITTWIWLSRCVYTVISGHVYFFLLPLLLSSYYR